MRTRVRCISPWHLSGALLAVTLLPAMATAASWTLVGWNNLGMHCMDADYAVFSLLPPYNTIHAQLIDTQGHLVRDATGMTVTYEAVADPDGSINTTSAGKTNFWQHVLALFGVDLPVDAGLKGNNMPGSANQPRAMTFDAAAGWFIAEGIPISPYDDQQHKNAYPLMRLTARSTAGAVLATTDIVLPVSDEMNCQACHTSGSDPAAQPRAGWVNDPDPQRDMRLNILRIHDDRELANDAFTSALTTAGYSAEGLFATATTGATPILCARCHRSEALADSGIDGVEPLTQAVHRRMALVIDPETGLSLSSTDNRTACYRCHPGAVTRCLRGVMGSAVAADGTLAIQCQSCHGTMLDVADPRRTGWLSEPKCQSCHTGTALSNNGALRYTSAFEASGAVRVAVDQTFATTPDTPGPGLSLYRFSTGHGGLSCEACHGSTHAELPSLERNDNIQSLQRQGHVGMLVECNSCHGNQPVTLDGGPHGMHPVGQSWINRHPSIGESEGGGSGAQACRTCHGADYRGTVLSRVKADRTLNLGEIGTSRHFWPGFQVGCYTCHLGPDNGDGNPNHPAVVSDASITTAIDTTATIALSAHDQDGDALELRIVSQPSHGTVALDGTQAQYFPAAGFSGDDTFTFAAWDGSTDSNLGTIAVAVSAEPTPTPSPLPTPTTPPIACVGDCSGDGTVTIDEVIRGVNIALGSVQLTNCPPFDANGDGEVTVDELIIAVNAALGTCPAG